MFFLLQITDFMRVSFEQDLHCGIEMQETKGPITLASDATFSTDGV